jgi:hypothetical protein
MSSPPYGNAETARWSQTVVDKFASFVVDMTENRRYSSDGARKFFVKRVEKVTDN